jgi:hypothetical protein
VGAIIFLRYTLQRILIPGVWSAIGKEFMGTVKTSSRRLLGLPLFGVTLGHAGAGGVVGRDSGYCVITLPGRLNHNLSSIDRRGRRGSSLSDGATFLWLLCQIASKDLRHTYNSLTYTLDIRRYPGHGPARRIGW